LLKKSIWAKDSLVVEEIDNIIIIVINTKIKIGINYCCWKKWEKSSALKINDEVRWRDSKTFDNEIGNKDVKCWTCVSQSHLFWMQRRLRNNWYSISVHFVLKLQSLLEMLRKMWSYSLLGKSQIPFEGDQKIGCNKKI